MKQKKYKTHRLFLDFIEPSTEDQYRKYIHDRSLIFTRITWFIVIFFVAVFSVRDDYFFGENADLVLSLRIGIGLLSGIMLFISKKKQLARFMDWSGFIFVFTLGLFNNVLIALDTTYGFSLWFAGLFFVFPGVFCTPGIGFRYSSFALVLNLIMFNVFYSVQTQVNGLMIYNVFLCGILLVNAFLAYLVETLFRKNYVALEDLKDSVNRVRHLSGLLPMCAKCKKIRNDKGYWQRVETYIQDHSEAEFSHGLCPVCLEDMYGDKEWFKKAKQKNSPL